jgi:hypothetical protein
VRHEALGSGQSWPRRHEADGGLTNPKKNRLPGSRFLQFPKS